MERDRIGDLFCGSGPDRREKKIDDPIRATGAKTLLSPLFINIFCNLSSLFEIFLAKKILYKFCISIREVSRGSRIGSRIGSTLGGSDRGLDRIPKMDLDLDRIDPKRRIGSCPAIFHVLWHFY